MKSEKGEKKEPRFDKEQYEMLLRCSAKKDMTEWNEWRKAHKKDEVWLEGAELRGASLRGADLWQANLQATELWGAQLGGARLGQAKLQDAELYEANLQGADLKDANLGGADLMEADLENANLRHANLVGANFRRAIVNGSTLVWQCEVSKCSGSIKGTDFRGVGLGVCKIDPGTKQLLEYNIRRMNWEDWYKEHRFWRWPVRGFWALSDYGRSTGWVIAWFFGLAIAFAFVYRLWPGCLIVRGEVGYIRGFVHALYFSVVTMTTLGFGDIAANPDSWGGQVLLMVQVILGYVLLGALITRFAVLFTAGGPAGRFAKEKK